MTRYNGFVESRQFPVISGWIHDSAFPGLPVTIDIIVDSKIIGRCLAAVYRQDLADAHIGSGYHSFSFKVSDKNIFDRIILCVSQDGWKLPYIFGPDADQASDDHLSETNNLINLEYIDGRVDVIDGSTISGWAMSSSDPQKRIELDIYVDEKFVDTVVAEAYREDLQVVFGDDGKHAFHYRHPAPIDQVAVSVRVRATGFTLEKDLKAAARTPARHRTIGAFDGLSGGIAAGWAYDPDYTDEPASVVFVANGQVLGTTFTSLYRGDVANAGFGNGFAGFRQELHLNIMQSDKIEVHAYLERTGEELSNSPIIFQIAASTRKWLTRVDSVQGERLSRLRARLNRETEGYLLSIVMPAYNTKSSWLMEAIDSVKRQWCSRWQLIIVDDCSPNDDVRKICAAFVESDDRIVYVRSEFNGGIAKSTNIGIKLAKGEYVAFMDHDDRLEPDAVYQYIKAMKKGADLIYCDEVITGESTDNIIQVCARPSFSYDYYLSHPYFVHMVCVRRSLAKSLNGWDERLTISGDVDFVLRVLARARSVAHIPAVLYRWRTHSKSAGHAFGSKVADATIGALRRHLKQIGVEGDVKNGDTFNQYQIEYKGNEGKILIVIPTKNRVDLLKPCIDSILSTTESADRSIIVIDHESHDIDTINYLNEISGHVQVVKYKGNFNYSAMNNFAVFSSEVEFEYVLLLNNDIEAIKPGWLQRLRSLASRSDVGVVAATLLYPDRTIQHSGVVVGLNGAADHAHKFKAFVNDDGVRNPGYLGSLCSTRDYSAVTAACMLIPKEIFQAVEGLDETLEVGFNDTDLCLRIGALGLKCLQDPHAVLIHKESATRLHTKEIDHPEDAARFLERWHELLEAGDPFYNPLLFIKGPDHVLAEKRARTRPARITSVISPKSPRRLLPRESRAEIVKRPHRRNLKEKDQNA